MSQEIEDVKQVEVSTEIEVKESIPTPSGKQLMKEKEVKDTITDVNSLLDQSRQASAELKSLIENNKKVMEDNAKILENIKLIQAQEILKGRAEAGQTLKVKEETPQEYAKRILGGNR